nr:unnamed protein product [Digitaria exilis]
MPATANDGAAMTVGYTLTIPEKGGASGIKLWLWLPQWMIPNRLMVVICTLLGPSRSSSSSSTSRPCRCRRSRNAWRA